MNDNLERFDADWQRLTDVVEDILGRARSLGATQAEVGANIHQGLAATVRLGETETIEFSRDRGVGITVYFGHRKGSASTADLAEGSIEQALNKACSIARFTEEDPYAGLADEALMATYLPDLDLWHPWQIEADQAVDMALEMEAAALEYDSQISNSEGATISSDLSLSVYGNSHGFLGRNRVTRQGATCVVIAAQDGQMQRDYWYDLARCADDLPPVTDIGRKAARRTIRRLGGRKLETMKAPVLFVPEMARGLLGHFVGAISGSALYRGASFLRDHIGKQIFPEFVRIHELPHEPRSLGATAYDAEGVATHNRDVVTDGVLQGYVLGSYSARKLGMETTANAGGVHNLTMEPGASDFQALLKEMGRGLVVTEMMGQGVKLISGDYSRGASGFWVEGGEIAYPVQEITVAGNLKDMFSNIAALGSDVDRRGGVRCGSILVSEMTIAGS